ncbi:hypothetical protein [Ornithinimicrobium kibberense]
MISDNRKSGWSTPSSHRHGSHDSTASAPRPATTSSSCSGGSWAKSL